MIRAITSLSILFYLLFFISGCATPPKPRIFWPIDEPKFEWLGNYYNENSFPKSETQKIVSEVVGDVAGFRFAMPFDAVFDSAGNIFVTDPAHQNIILFDFTKKTVGPFLESGLINSPMGIDIDSTGKFYVVDAQAKSIKLFTPEGLFIRTIKGNDHLSRPSYIALNERLSRIYVSDAVKHHIAVFDLNGKHLFNIGTRGSTEGKFHLPQGIAINADNELYVADMLNHRIQAFDADGNFIRTFGEIGDQVGNFESPKDLDFDSDGNLHILDARKGTLLSYTSDGTLLLEFGGKVSNNISLGMASPKGLYIDSNDKIVIVDMLMKRVMLFQFLSDRHKAISPVTPEDIQYLQKYLEQQQEK